jgi:hypothetical protein
MQRITKTLFIAGLVLVVATSVGASAFTSATVERQANADVVTDENGLLGLTDGNSGNLVYQDAATDQLVIDFENGTATGANTDALFELGDPANPGTSQAFSTTTTNPTRLPPATRSMLTTVTPTRTSSTVSTTAPVRSSAR